MSPLGVIVVVVLVDLLGFTLVKLLQLYMPGPEWVCYAIVTAAFAVGGGGLWFAGVTRFKQIHAMPQTVASLRQPGLRLKNYKASDEGNGQNQQQLWMFAVDPAKKSLKTCSISKRSKTPKSASCASTNLPWYFVASTSRDA